MNCSHCRALTLCAISLALITGLVYSFTPASRPTFRTSSPPITRPGPLCKT